MTFPGWEGTLPPTHFGKVLRFLWGGGSLPAHARRGAELSLGSEGTPRPRPARGCAFSGVGDAPARARQGAAFSLGREAIPARPWRGAAVLPGWGYSRLCLTGCRAFSRVGGHSHPHPCKALRFRSDGGLPPIPSKVLRFSPAGVTLTRAGQGAGFFPGAGGHSRPLDREPLPPWQGAAKCKRNLSKTGEKWAGSENFSKNAKACRFPTKLVLLF